MARSVRIESAVYADHPVTQEMRANPRMRLSVAALIARPRDIRSHFEEGVLFPASGGIPFPEHNA